MAEFREAARVIQAGLEDAAFPAAVIEVGRTQGVLWREAFGRLTYDASARVCDADTIFDLASLTKVVATASLAMRHVAAGALALDAPLRTYLPGWDAGDRAHVTIRRLLTHSSGLPAHVRLFADARGRAEFEARIRDLPLVFAPGAQSVYSDLGITLLGFVLEDLGGAPLNEQFRGLVSSHIVAPLAYRPPDAWRARIAPTEQDPWRGRLICGEVHDENGAALDGVAAHAGLFGTAEAVGAFARTVLASFTAPTWLASPERMREFAAPCGVPGSSRALAWDTMRPTSSCGTRMSSEAIGHTGFTGTSLWIDPRLDVYVVLLTNRVHPTRANEKLIPLRPRVHDAVMRALA